MKCIIIEDEIPAQNIIKNFIGRLPNMELIGVFRAAVEATVFFNNDKTDADVVFLDINLPDASGLDFIRTVKNPPAIVMTTAYPDFAVDSFELDTIVDYLVKPFSFNRFVKAINKVENRNEKVSLSEKEKEAIFLNVDKTLHKIIVDDILYIESDRNYISFVTTNKKLPIIDSLRNWKDKLPKEKFLQVQKSYIINLKKIDKISGNEVFIGNKKIPVGRTFKKKLLIQLEID